MTRLKVKSEHTYEVEIGVNFQAALKNITNAHRKILLIAPTALIKKFKIKESSSLFILATPEAENQKTVQVLERIWQRAAAIGIERSDAFIGFGGGATTDVAGFAAATWLRGVNWYSIPTSLAGMVDAAIGGKTGINSPAGKNLIGSFYSPTKVYIDVDFLHTLPKRDINAGLAEVIKCGFIADYKILNLVQEDSLDYSQLIHRAVKVKAQVVSKDFKENKRREILNYGHTLGHAIEKDSKYKLRHGEAVSIGMVFAAELSADLAGLSKDAVLLHREILTRFDLPITYTKKSLKNLLGLLAQDKKVKDSRIRFVGISRIGKPVWFEDVSLKKISKVYERIVR